MKLFSACLTSSNGWALHQEHILEGPGGWVGDAENCPMLAGGMASYDHRATPVPYGVATNCWAGWPEPDDSVKYPAVTAHLESLAAHLGP
eukprot:1156557-Pelagomonas_calceolata.AAC.2